MNFFHLNNINSEEYTPDEKIYQDIKNHLMYLLNVKRGSLIHLPDYGLPDLVQIYQELPYSAASLVRDVTKVLEKYEPRLRRIKVGHKQSTANEDCVIFLEISAELLSGDKITYDGYFMPDGEAKL